MSRKNAQQACENNPVEAELRCQLMELTTKYEQSKGHLQQLTKFANKIKSDYEILKVKYSETQLQFQMVQDKLAESESKLRNLENVLEPAVVEFNHLENQFEIEKGCRTEAENYARKLRKENQHLKRQSQELLLKFQAVEINLDNEIKEPWEEQTIDDERDKLNMKIQALEERNKELEDVLGYTEKQRQEFYEREQYLSGKVKDLEKKLNNAGRMEKDRAEQLDGLKRVSQLVWQEFQEIKERYEKEFKLKCEAERYASEMLSERDAVIRESSILLASASNDQRLASSLLAIEDLTKTLNNERLERQREVQELKDELILLQSSSQHQLEYRLQMAVEEAEQLYSTMQDMEGKIHKLEAENATLLGKLEVCEERLRPPTPPPLPPPLAPVPRFSPFRIFIRSKKSLKNSLTTETESSTREKTYEEAVKEMMDRIKSGKTLKATEQRQKNRPDEELGKSTMHELQRFIGSLKTTPRLRENSLDESNNTSSPAEGSESPWGGRRELRRLQRSATVEPTSSPFSPSSMSTSSECELFKVFRARGKTNNDDAI